MDVAVVGFWFCCFRDIIVVIVVFVVYVVFVVVLIVFVVAAFITSFNAIDVVILVAFSVTLELTLIVLFV